MPYKKHIRLNLQNQSGTPEANAAILQHVRDLLTNLCAPRQCIGAYWPLSGEVDCLPLLQVLHRSHFQIALPGKDAPLQFRTWTPGDALVPGFKSALQSSDDKPLLQPDLLLIPLFGFRRDGYRLGRGGGFYDRTLADWRTRNIHCVTIGLGFANREVPDLPVEAHDERLDWIVTEDGIFKTEV